MLGCSSAADGSVSAAAAKEPSSLLSVSTLRKASTMRLLTPPAVAKRSSGSLPCSRCLRIALRSLQRECVSAQLVTATGVQCEALRERLSDCCLCLCPTSRLTVHMVGTRSLQCRLQATAEQATSQQLAGRMHSEKTPHTLFGSVPAWYSPMSRFLSSCCAASHLHTAAASVQPKLCRRPAQCALSS